MAPTGSRLYRGLVARFVFHNRSPITDRRYSERDVTGPLLEILASLEFLGTTKHDKARQGTTKHD